MKIKLTICYLGTNYAGWQIQNNTVSVQQKIQDAVESLFSVRYPVTGCSRTDSGVHANDFCCTVSLGENKCNISEDKLPYALNHRLPFDIAVKSADYVNDDFHPRYDVKYKEYEYLIYNSGLRSPFYENRAFFYPSKLDEILMERAASHFLGKHDFAAFMASGSDIKDTVREIKYFTVKRDGDIIRINVAADGFLYNMVRILVGTLIEVSEGKINIEDIDDIILSKDRKRAGFTVQPHGLYLNKVIY